MREGASTAGIVMRDKAARACWVTFYFGQFIEKIGNRGDFIGFLGNAGPPVPQEPIGVAAPNGRSTAMPLLLELDVHDLGDGGPHLYFCFQPRSELF
jgi:hypothetical protein